MTAVEKIAPYWKAVAAFLTPPVTALGVALTESSDGGTAVTATEWVGIALAALATGTVVYAVPNKDPRAQHQDESVQPPSTGAHRLEVTGTSPHAEDDGPDVHSVWKNG